MKNYKVTVNGKTYDVGVEENGGGAQVKTVQVEAKPVQAAAPAPKAAAPTPKAAPVSNAAPAKQAGSGDVMAPMSGKVLSVAVSVGQQVKVGQVLMIFEAMKMENEIVAPCAGTVKKVNVSAGTALETGMLLVSIA